MKTALQIEQISKSYSGKEVVKGISLQIEAGEIFGLLGPNGAGKSTTINMITGVTSVDRGKISVFGFDNQANFIQTRRLVGVMHQEIVVDTFFTIDKALEIHSGYYGVPDNKKWRSELIERLALGPHLNKSMNKLSGGMKRRFMVAKALIHQPQLLILDEPTAGVDVELRKQLWEFVRELNEKRGITVLLTTHYLEEAEEMCGRIAIMNHGNVIAMNKTHALLDQLDEKRMIVHFEKNIHEVPVALKAYEATVEEAGMAVSLKIAKGASVADALTAITSMGLTIRDIETRAPNLEEAFLKLTAGTHGAHHA